MFDSHSRRSSSQENSRVELLIHATSNFRSTRNTDLANRAELQEGPAMASHPNQSALRPGRLCSYFHNSKMYIVLLSARLEHKTCILDYGQNPFAILEDKKGANPRDNVCLS